jgi:hypothetical protein
MQVLVLRKASAEQQTLEVVEVHALSKNIMLETVALE